MKERNKEGTSRTTSSGMMIYEPKMGCGVSELRPWGVAKFESGAFDCVKEPS